MYLICRLWTLPDVIFNLLHDSFYRLFRKFSQFFLDGIPIP